MTDQLLAQILNRAYQQDSAGLDIIARRLGAADFPALTAGLELGGWDSGGGCMMMVAELPLEHHLQITDGEVDIPTDSEHWCVGIVDPDGDELITVFSAS